MVLVTVIIVKRDSYKTVTNELPILIPASDEEKEGVATFQQELLPPVPVRTFKNSDLQNAKKHMTEAEAKHFSAVVALTQALQNPSDTLALHNANAAFEEAYKLRRIEPSSFAELGPEFAHSLARIIGVPPQEAVEVLERKRPGPRAASDPRRMLSYAISEALETSSRLVLWWNGVRFTPAIWCDNAKTAFYVRALLDVVGGTGIRICPHCGEPFFQERPNQNYCSIAHREAHRVARWRSRQKQKATRKGNKRGARKTR